MGDSSKRAISSELALLEAVSTTSIVGTTPVTLKMRAITILSHCKPLQGSKKETSAVKREQKEFLAFQPEMIGTYNGGNII